MAIVTLTLTDLPDGTVEMKLRTDPPLGPDMTDADLSLAQLVGAECQLFVRRICDCAEMDGPLAEGMN